MLTSSEKNSTANLKSIGNNNIVGKISKLLNKRFSKKENNLESIHESFEPGLSGKDYLENAIWKAREKLNLVYRKSLEYKLDVKRLGLCSEIEENSFLYNQKKASLIIDELKKEAVRSMERYATISSMENNIRTSISDLNKQISKMKLNPDSNIDFELQDLRDEMAESLGLKREESVFIGELIDVKKDEKEWQGAIEKVLFDHLTILIVPIKYYQMVKRWFDICDNNFNIKITAFDNFEKRDFKGELKLNGFLKKLIWKEHPYKNYIKNYLQNFDLNCIENLSEIKNNPFSIAKNGEIQLKKGEFLNNTDHRVDDKRRWRLGFSNKSRLNIFLKDKNELTIRLLKTAKLKKYSKSDLDSVFEEKSLWEKVCLYKWEEINFLTFRAELKMLKFELQKAVKDQKVITSTSHMVRA